ncbi:restriction endonuclease [Azospirillum sp. HJ39]|uniref:restriction endonuclease n=1 Tax=Azospirillum sp. HJ39 TaxID=3159496 RepID=UPI003559235B
MPTLQALENLGGSARADELNAEIAKLMDLSDEVLNYRRPTSSTNEVPYRSAWARTYLRMYGAIERTSHGVWALTPIGRGLTPEQVKQIPSKVRAMQAAKKAKALVASSEQDDIANPVADVPAAIVQEVEAEVNADWKTQLLGVLLTMSPAAFERLAQRILRESGFVKVEVKGKSGDGGIDGIGVLRLTLISFQVLFQCKRYQGSVTAGEIRDFRGAMVGRTDKGLFITTGRFTSDARREATRDGAPPVELIDGEGLCDLLKDLRIGVSTRQVEVVSVHPEVFGAV